MKKVLVINTAGSSIGNGIFHVAFNYIRLSCDKYQYDFVCAGRKTDDAKALMEEMGVRVLYPPVSRLKQPARYMLWLKKLMTENQYDIMHVHGNSATMYIEIHAAKKAGIEKRICHVHSTSCKYMLVHKILKRPMLKEMTAAAACSREAGQWVFGDRFTVLPNGINTEQFAYQEAARNEIRSALGLRDQFVIGQVGYLSEEKNQAFSIELAHALKAEMKNVVLLLIGDGAWLDQLKAKVKSLGVENEVRLLGKRSDVHQLYAAMDCYLLPSLYEGFGLSIMEAQASGLSCIASDRVPQITRVSGHTVYLPLEDRSAWVEQIRKIAAESTDRKLESQANIKEIIRKGYDMRGNVNQLIALYGGK